MPIGPYIPSSFLYFRTKVDLRKSAYKVDLATPKEVRRCRCDNGRRPNATAGSLTTQTTFEMSPTKAATLLHLRLAADSALAVIGT